MKVIGERIGDCRLKYFSDTAETQNDCAVRAQIAHRSRALVVAALLNILRDDRDSTVNRATARRQDLAASKVIARARAALAYTKSRARERRKPFSGVRCFSLSRVSS